MSLLYSQSNIFIQYDTTIFGTNLVSSGKITASKGQAIDSPYYNVSITDSLPNMIKLSVTHTPNPTSLANLDSVNQQLCHLKINVSGFNLTSVAAAFDTLAMTNRSQYKRTIYGLEAPYDIVRVSGLVGALRSSIDSIVYQIVLDTIKPTQYLSYFSPPDTIVFDIQARSLAGDYIYDADPVISYNTDAFGAYVCTNGKLICTSTASSAYNFFLPGDLTSNAFQIHLDADDPGNYDTYYPDSAIQVGGYPITIATCKLILSNCCAGAIHLSVNSQSSAYYGYMDYTDSSIHYAPYGVSLGAGYDTTGSLCSSPNPTITGIYPTSIPAGTFDTLTIMGYGFGCTAGQVLFTNGSGISIAASTVYNQPPDIISWEDNQIQLIVASCRDFLNDYYIPSTGPILLYLNGSYSNQSDTLFIPYSVLNDRLFSKRAIPVGLSGFGNQYTFIPDTTITANPPSLATITHAMNDWVCETGVRFTIGTPVDSNLRVWPDHINSILFGNLSGVEADAETHIWPSTPRINASGDSVEVIADIDIVFDQTLLNQFIPYPWFLNNTSTIPSPVSPALGYASLLGMARHEFGHAHGLRHVLNINDLMYPTTFFDICKVIHTDDRYGGLYELTMVGPVLNPNFIANPQNYPINCPSTTLNGITDMSSNTYNVNAYPNPFDQTIMISAFIGTQSEVKIELIDILGQVISSNDYGTIMDTQFQKSISTASISAGVYLLRVKINDRIGVLKLIKN